MVKHLPTSPTKNKKVSIYIVSHPPPLAYLLFLESLDLGGGGSRNLVTANLTNK